MAKEVRYRIIQDHHGYFMAEILSATLSSGRDLWMYVGGTMSRSLNECREQLLKGYPKYVFGDPVEEMGTITLVQDKEGKKHVEIQPESFTVTATKIDGNPEQDAPANGGFTVAGSGSVTGSGGTDTPSD